MSFISDSSIQGPDILLLLRMLCGICSFETRLLDSDGAAVAAAPFVDEIDNLVVIRGGGKSGK